jgi:DNA-binding MarR family transcriptional regulator
VGDDRTREELLEAFNREMRKVVVETVLFNQAVADQLGLNASDVQCLNVLTLAGPVTAGQLAQLMGLTTGAVTRMVDRLEEAGYVRRERDTADRRRVTVTPLPERLGEVGRYYLSIGQAWGDLLAPYGDEELALFVDLLSRGHPITREATAQLRAAPDAGR